MTQKDETDAAFLNNLACRLFRNAAPAMGFDQNDVDQLYRIARSLSRHDEAGKLQPIVEGATDNGAPPLSADELAAAIAQYATPATPPSDHIAIPEGEVASLRALVKRCDMLVSRIVDGAQDEGGRVYFNDTEELDDLRELGDVLEHEVYRIMEAEGD